MSTRTLQLALAVIAAIVSLACWVSAERDYLRASAANSSLGIQYSKAANDRDYWASECCKLANELQEITGEARELHGPPN